MWLGRVLKIYKKKMERVFCGIPDVADLILCHVPRFRDLATLSAVSHGFRQMVLALSPEYVLSMRVGQEDTLHDACEKGYTRLVEALVGNDPAVAGVALSHAVKHGHMDMCTRLMFMVDLPVEWLPQLLYRAAYYGHTVIFNKIDDELVKKYLTVPPNLKGDVDSLWTKARNLSVITNKNISDARIVEMFTGFSNPFYFLPLVALVPARSTCLRQLVDMIIINPLFRRVAVIATITYGNIPGLEVLKDYLREDHCAFVGRNPEKYIQIAGRNEFFDVKGEPCTWQDVFVAHDAHVAAVTHAKKIVAEQKIKG